MTGIGFLKDAVPVRDAWALCDEATHSPFLDALAGGTLPTQPSRRWLAQDYFFARALVSYQATRRRRRRLLGGLASRITQADDRPDSSGRRNTSSLV